MKVYLTQFDRKQETLTLVVQREEATAMAITLTFEEFHYLLPQLSELHELLFPSDAKVVELPKL